MVHEHVLLGNVVIVHLILEFVPLLLISPLLGVLIELPEIFVPSLLPETLEPIELVIANFPIIVASERLHGVLDDILAKLLGYIVYRCESVTHFSENKTNNTT